MEKTTLSYSIVPAWVVIENMESKIRDFFKDEDEEILNATLMTASELIENAVKYEKCGAQMRSIEIQFIAEDQLVTIVVSNPVLDSNHLTFLEEHIRKIALCRERRQLYAERMKELLENKYSGESRLGLYRIAYEGKFDLSYTYDDPVLTVTARREWKGIQE